MSIRRCLLTLLLSLLACAPAWAGPLYTATFLPENFMAAGIDNDGSIVGTGLDADFQQRAFVWRAGTTTFLPTPGASIAYATAIRNGTVVGAAQVGGVTRGVIWRDGATQSIGTLYGGDSVAHGVNAAGQVVGESTDVTGNSRAFLYSGGTLTDLGTLGGANAQAWGINDAGMVVGGSQPGAGFPDDGAHAFLYAGGAMHDLGTLGGGFSWAEAVNDAGQVAGYSLIGPDAVWHPFLYSGGVMHDLGSFGGDYGEAHAINAAGVVVGYSSFAGDGFSHAFVAAGAGLVDLNTVTAGLGSQVLMDAVGINDAGQIAANSCNDFGYCAPVLLTPVPEPAPALLLPMGGLVLMWWRRRTVRRTDAAMHDGAGKLGELLSSVHGQARDGLADLQTPGGTMTTTDTADAHAIEHLTPRQRVFAIVGASSGNLVEWFDFYIYSFCALYFSSAFFPKGNPTTQLLNTAGIFAAGFLMRPIGGWLFGRVADRYGRRNAMMISVLMMCGGSLMIAALPTYASIGTAAPTLLLVARLFQGLSVGGEYGTSATYMSEVAEPGRKGFFASFQYVTLIGGQLAALLVLGILQLLLTHDELKAWGWRIPFVVGALAALVSLYLRRSLHETTTATERKSEAAGSVASLLKHHRRAFVTVLGFTAGGSLIFYAFTTYMQKYLVNTAGMSTETASRVMTVCLLIYMLLQPAFGALSDRIGRRTSMIWFGALTAVFTTPIMMALRSVSSPVTAGALIVCALAMISLYTSIGGLIKAEMFPVEVRALGVGLSYAVANAIFGGSAEYVALWFKQAGHEPYFYWYVSVMCALACLVAIRMPDPAKSGLLK